MRVGEWVKRANLSFAAILLLAGALRFWGLGEVPPGLAHDEVANWLIARQILSGHHAVYFTAAYGHEPLYQYLQAAMVALFGDHWLGLRYPSVALGLLGIAVTGVLARRLFGRTVALLASLYLAVGFWPLFYARVALRAIALPLTAALAAYALFRLLDLLQKQHRDGLRQSVGLWGSAFGLFLGLSLYTYMAARVLPLIFAAYLAYLALFHRDRLRGRGRGLLWGLLVAAAIAAPLVVWLATHPGAEARVAEVREPLDRLLAGDPSPVWENLKANLGMFTFQGDPWPRQNLPGRPVFPDLLNGLLFYAGVGIALWRWRDPRHALLLIWLAGSLVPSILTSVAPSSIRDILAIVVLFIFPSLPLSLIADRLSLFSSRPRATCLLVIGLLATCLLTHSLSTAHDYFLLWPRHEVVRFDYQTALTATARRVDELGIDVPIVVAGLSVHSMDGPGIELAARGRTAHVRLCDTREALVVPAGIGGRLLVPEVVPFDPDLQGRLLAWGGQKVGGMDAPFDEYLLPDASAVQGVLTETAAFLPDGTSVPLPALFGDALALVGIEWLEGDAVAGGSLSLLTIWRVESPPPDPLKVFVHLLDAEGRRRAQHDGLGSPPQGWALGDLILQKHTLDLPSDLEVGTCVVQVGLYWAPDGPRLPVAGADRLLLTSIEVEVP
ncbi:MAG TPA: hypothetical protein EYH30_03245 [Anaerolineales bacterium]|nr:hypothetical protein [Anaerolineales bacterium]